MTRSPQLAELSRETVSRETVTDIALEEWREVSIAPGYQVSNLGRVMSPSGRFIGKPNHMRGYVRVNLPGQRITMVHQLVAEAFLGPSHGAHVLHIDTDPTNNRADNLKYGTTPYGADWRKS